MFFSSILTPHLITAHHSLVLRLMLQSIYRTATVTVLGRSVPSPSRPANDGPYTVYESVPNIHVSFVGPSYRCDYYNIQYTRYRSRGTIRCSPRIRTNGDRRSCTAHTTVVPQH